MMVKTALSDIKKPKIPYCSTSKNTRPKKKNLDPIPSNSLKNIEKCLYFLLYLRTVTTKKINYQIVDLERPSSWNFFKNPFQICKQVIFRLFLFYIVSYICNHPSTL